MLNESVHYENTDILLMDPCYSRVCDWDMDSELYCSDLVVDTYADGYYYVIKGRLKDMEERLDEIAENPEKYAIGEFCVDSARIGVYDYHKAIEERPTLKEQIVNNEISVAVIRNFTGSITAFTDDDGEVYIVGKSDDGDHDFFVVSL